MGDLPVLEQYRPPLDPIVCRDGAVVSIQASANHYCTPRNHVGPYQTVEAGFPSVEPPPSWRPYAEDDTVLTGTVYAQLPWDCVDEFINLHGGLIMGKLPERG